MYRRAGTRRCDFWETKGGRWGEEISLARSFRCNLSTYWRLEIEKAEREQVGDAG